MAKFTKGVALLCIFTIIMLAAGCKEPKSGGVLVQPLIGIPGIINPLLATDSSARILESKIFEGLVRFNYNLEPEGLLAQGWNTSPDGMIWTFYLKEGIRWHDGEPFTAYDVKFTLDTIAFNPDYPGTLTSRLDMLETVEVLDEHTLTLTLNQVHAPFIGIMTFPIIPRHLFDPELYTGEGYASLSDLYTHPVNWSPVGTGPWVFSGWGEDHVTLRRNPDYQDKSVPYIEKILYRFYKDNKAALSALKAGEVDLLTGLPPEEVIRAQRTLESTHNFYDYQDMNYEFLGFNFRPDAFGEGLVNPWLDHQVRQAVANALNRSWYISKLLRGRGTLMHSAIPPTSWAYARDEVTIYRFDPVLARLLLEEAGWELDPDDGYRYKTLGLDPEGKPIRQQLKFQLSTNENNERRTALAELIKKDLEAVGIAVELNLVSWNKLVYELVYPGKFEMIILGWSLGLDPDSYSIFHSSQVEGGNNFGAYINPSVDSLLDSGRWTMDVRQRKKIYAALQQELSQDLPYVFLFSRTEVAVVHKRVKGVILSPLGLWNTERWHIDE